MPSTKPRVMASVRDRVLYSVMCAYDQTPQRAHKVMNFTNQLTQDRLQIAMGAGNDIQAVQFVPAKPIAAQPAPAPDRRVTVEDLAASILSLAKLLVEHAEQQKLGDQLLRDALSDPYSTSLIDAVHGRVQQQPFCFAA